MYDLGRKAINQLPQKKRFLLVRLIISNALFIIRSKNQLTD